MHLVGCAYELLRPYLHASKLACWGSFFFVQETAWSKNERERSLTPCCHGVIARKNQLEASTFLHQCAGPFGGRDRLGSVSSAELVSQGHETLEMPTKPGSLEHDSRGVTAWLKSSNHRKRGTTRKWTSDSWESATFAMLRLRVRSPSAPLASLCAEILCGNDHGITSRYETLPWQSYYRVDAPKSLRRMPLCRAMVAELRLV